MKSTSSWSLTLWGCSQQPKTAHGDLPLEEASVPESSSSGPRCLFWETKQATRSLLCDVLEHCILLFFHTLYTAFTEVPQGLMGNESRLYPDANLSLRGLLWALRKGKSCICLRNPYQVEFLVTYTHAGHAMASDRHGCLSVTLVSVGYGWRTSLGLALSGTLLRVE